MCSSIGGDILWPYLKIDARKGINEYVRFKSSQSRRRYIPQFQEY